MMKTEETFHVTELFLLAAAFDGEMIFGLPDKKAYQLMGDEIFKEANDQLIEKGILTPEGKMTKGGFYAVRALELYYNSKKYVRIQNMMFGFQEKDEDELIMLMEMEEGTYYRLYMISKALVLTLLSDRFPFILREPQEDEKEFLQKEVSSAMKEKLVQFEPGDDFMNLEFFHLQEEQRVRESQGFNFRGEDKTTPTSEKSVAQESSEIEAEEPLYQLNIAYEQWFVFPKGDQLFMVDPMENNYYRASQYWFLKMLFEQMDFPYKEASVND